MRLKLDSASTTSSVGVLHRRALLQCAAFALTSLAPTLPTHAISATTMSGKSKPELGVILVDEPKQAGSSITAEVVLADGQIATIGFEPEPKWSLEVGGYYDIEARSKDGDSAFVQLAPLPKGKSLDSLKPSWFTAQVLGVEGRYGSYGAPIDIKVLADTTSGATRSFDVSFTALSPGMAEVPRRAVLTATQGGSGDVIMLVSGTSSTRWKKSGGEAAARKASSSFRVLSTRPSALKQEASADYRYGKTSGPSTMSSRNDGF